MIYVGASDWEDKRWRATWGGSNYGPGIDVFAPGAFITSASHVDVNQYKLMSGTSMASIWSINGLETNLVLRLLLMSLASSRA